MVLTKYDRNAFSNPDLIANLRLRNIDHLIVDGLLTEHGVEFAVRAALGFGFTVGLAATACAGASLTAHDRAVRDMVVAGAQVIR